jgi:hypothetical protein
LIHDRQLIGNGHHGIAVSKDDQTFRVSESEERHETKRRRENRETEMEGERQRETGEPT